MAQAIRRALAAFGHRIDWSLVITIVGFVLTVPGGGAGSNLLGAPLRWLSRHLSTDQHVAYERGLAAAALKRPEYAMPLRTVDRASATVRVVSFGPPGPPVRDRNFDVWVALPDELRQACAGADDAVLALQQVLGLPPVAAPDRVVTELEVSPDALFRPCASGADITASSCGFDLPPPPKEGASSADLLEAYQNLRFIVQQMWGSYRTGFSREGRSGSDYRYTGIPFTAMGWSYNWDAASQTHVGVTEFAIKRSETIRIVGAKTPREFCAKSD